MNTSTTFQAISTPTAADLKITDITITPIAFSDPRCSTPSASMNRWSTGW